MLPLGDRGAAVLRLTTRPRAVVPGHALLIGSPLGGLGGVDDCLQRIGAWLGDDYTVVEGPLGPTKANIEAQMDRLLEVVEFGDQVLVYYAGHGEQWLPDPERHDEPVAVLVPIDARDPGHARSGFIPGYQLVEWLAEVAQKCGSTTPRLDTRRTEPSVTVILECCHAAGLMDAWPSEEEERLAIEKAMAKAAERRSLDSMARVVRVMATGRDEIALGPLGGDVGRMTHALVDVLQQHPEEPWWALWDRLLAAWIEPTQTPRMAGPTALIPRMGRRRPRPDGLIACRSGDGEGWHGTMADPMGWTPGQRVLLTASLGGPEQAWGRVEGGEGADAVRIRVSEASALSGRAFAWAARHAPGLAAAVDVWGDEPSRRAEVIERLRACARTVRDRESEAHPAVAPRLDPRRLPLHLHHPVGFEVCGDTVVIHDRFGDRVARTALDDIATWRAWLDRLTTLDDWLTRQDAPDWPEDGFTLRWGTWPSGVEGPSQAWDGRAPPHLTPRTPLWIELEATDQCTPAYASVFRIRADRSVEALTRHAPAGLPVTGRYPVVTLGRADKPLRLAWPVVHGTGPRREQLVVMVSRRPLPMTMLELGPVREKTRGQWRGRGARLGMLVRGYWLGR